MSTLSYLRSITALKKCLFLSLTLGLIGFIVYVLQPPPDLTVHTQLHTYSLSVDEPLVIPVFHATKTHPFLAAGAIATAYIENDQRTLQLTLTAVSNSEALREGYVSYLTLITPFRTLEQPFVLLDGTLVLTLLNGQTLDLTLGHLGIFLGDYLTHFSVETMHGFFHESSLTGMYLTLKNRSTVRQCIQGFGFGFEPLAVDIDEAINTDDPFTMHQALEDYQRMPKTPCLEPQTTGTYLLEFPVTWPLEKVPVCLYFSSHRGSVTECMQPFRFVSVPIELTTQPRIAGVLSD